MNAIYLIVDRRFLPVGRAQALHLARTWDVDVHLFVEDPVVTVCAPVNHPRVRIHLNQVQAQLPKGLPESAKWPIVVFSRNYVPALLREYERLIYVDVDILCRKADPSIWAIDLPHGLAAVRDVFNIDRAPLDTGMQLNEWMEAIGVTGGRYFNSGMLLIDPKRWDTGRLESLLTSYFADRKVKAIKSQDFLNFAFDGKWTELSPRWNWQPAYFELGLDRLLDPIIIHYCNRIKPWFYPHWRGLSRQRHEAEQAFFDMFSAVGVSPRDVAESDSRHVLKRAGQWVRQQGTRAGIKFRRETRALKNWDERSRRLWSHLQGALAEGAYADLRTPLAARRPSPDLWFDGHVMRERLPGDPVW